MSGRRQIIESWLAAYNRHDGAAFASYFTEDGVMRHVLGGEVHGGRDQIQELMEDVWRAVPDWNLELRGLYECGDVVWLAWTITGTHEGEFRGLQPTHRHLEMLGCSHITFDTEDLIARDDVYHDAVAMMRVLGMLPEAEAAEPV